MIGPGIRTTALLLLTAVLACCSIFGAGASAPSAGLPILVYHQIRDTADGPPNSPEAISLDRFKTQMQYLHEHGYVTLSADEVVRYLQGNYPQGKKVAAIHFDDGWTSARLALPVLDAYGFKATFWIIAGKGIGQPHMQWDEIQAISRNPRYDIHSHTMSHPWKPADTMLDWINGRTPGKQSDQVRWELTESRRVLTEKIGRPVPYLAWPAGHYNDAMIELARQSGYVALFTIDNGINYPGDDPLKIRRTMVHGGCDNDAFAQILHDGVYRDCNAGVATPLK